MLRKLKFFIIGLIPGLLFVLFILNKKGAKCSGYLPNSRVIAESLSKDFSYSDGFKREMKALGVDEKFIKDSILTEGEIDFDQSHAQAEPCPDYMIRYPKKNPNFEMTFQKCNDSIYLWNIKNLK